MALAILRFTEHRLFTPLRLLTGRYLEVLDTYGSRGEGGGGTSIYGLNRYVPRDRVGFLRFSILKKGIVFAPVNSVFPVLR